MTGSGRRAWPATRARRADSSTPSGQPGCIAAQAVRRRPKRESVSSFLRRTGRGLSPRLQALRAAGDAPPARGLSVREAAAFIAARRRADRPLLRLARQVGTSPFHLRSVCPHRRHPPRASAAALRAAVSARPQERKTAGRRDLDAGYDQRSRHERPPTGRGVTPAEYRRGARTRRS